MEEEKDQLIKRVERLKKRVRHPDPTEPLMLLILGTPLDSLWNENMTSRHISSLSSKKNQPKTTRQVAKPS